MKNVEVDIKRRPVSDMIEEKVLKIIYSTIILLN